MRAAVKSQATMARQVSIKAVPINVTSARAWIAAYHKRSGASVRTPEGSAREITPDVASAKVWILDHRFALGKSSYMDLSIRALLTVHHTR
jgi:hypothetical protein